MNKMLFDEFGLNSDKVYGSTDRLGFILTADDITLLISALSKYVQSSSLEHTVNIQDSIYVYISAKTYENYIYFLSHAYDLQCRLINFLKNFD